DGVVVKNLPGDDGLNVHGSYITVGSVSSRTITFSDNLFADLKADSRIQFLDANFQPLWTGTVESSDPKIVNSGPITVVLKETPPSWIVAGTTASPLGWVPKSFIVKNSTFENTGRFGISAKTFNVVIDSSSFRFNGLAGVHAGSSFNNFFQEAQPAWNVVVKNSTFENNIRRYVGTAEQGALLVDQISVDNPNINGNLYLFNNTFKDELYAYNLRDATNIRLWGNVYNNVTTPIWRNSPTTSNFSQSTVFNDYVTDDLARPVILYNETWTTSSNTLDSLGTVTWSNKAGSFAEFHFVGNHISYYARKGSQMGMVDVYLDDVLVLDDFDLYSGPVQTKSLIYTNNNLQNTTHTLRIENTGLRNTNAGNNYVNIDFLVHKLGNYVVKPTPVNSSLPITLLDFYGKPELNHIKLNWQTTNEINNSHFELLKLDDNYQFNAIGRVDAIKTPSSLNNYSLNDYKPNKGSNYYQLKQYDFDGKLSLSKIIEVNFNLKPSFSVFPNPAKLGEIVNMTLLSPDSEVDFQLIDMNQRVVMQKFFDRKISNLEWNTTGLQPGIYILKLKTKTDQFVNKIIIIP
ncbi:MAG TPA: T9SS type A sorting domain-containing protein, partial [Pelobium sp.]|nr:T9SS type A sorting domain-containing protein [Pelobium sp.]